MPSFDHPDPRRLLQGMYDAAVAAAHPRAIVRRHLPPPPKGRTIVIGAGKASAAMAETLEQAWGGDLSGVVVTRDGYARPTLHIEVAEAGHPIPDERSVHAARRLLHLAATAGDDDLILCLISGGASALAAMPRQGVNLGEKQAVTRRLLARGAAIDDINCVRKHLSSVKGGQLAAAAGKTRIRSLIISDVVGDNIGVIGSGLTAPDPSTCADALRIIDRYQVSISDGVRSQLLSGVWETPKQLPSTVENIIIARPRDGLAAATAFAANHGLPCINLGDRFSASAGEVAAAHVRAINDVLEGTHTVKAPCVIVSGGEAVVNVVGDGRGGPNTEFALALAASLPRRAKIWGIAADTDGTDGIGGHAGAMIAPDTVVRAQAEGLDPQAFLSRNDTASFFERLGDLLVPGPTFTNINDFRAIYVSAP